ncbi:hypothetical protein J6590_031395 [Homalodisca vitripennis]|nr:hypothetical protein J6590_031395 [Homalodisca vitripennis]
MTCRLVAPLCCVDTHFAADSSGRRACRSRRSCQDGDEDKAYNESRALRNRDVSCFERHRVREQPKSPECCRIVTKPAAGVRVGSSPLLRIEEGL